MQNVARLADIAADRGTAVTLGENTLLLVRAGAAVHAFEGKCPHAGAPLAEGAVCNGAIVCPWHKAAFSVEDGTLLEPPALRGLKRYRTEVRDGDVFVDPQEMAPQEVVAPALPADKRRVVVLGGGAAGAACVAALREFGFGGAITLVSGEGVSGEGASGEAERPYDRTALSKFVLEGGKAPDEVAAVLPEAFFAEQDVRPVQAVATGLDVVGRSVALGDGGSLGFDRLVIATGGVPKAADIPGADLPGVFALRSKADAAGIVARAEQGGSAVILGSSFIGLESASALRKRGLGVTVVSPEAIPFATQFGEEIGRMFRALHEKNGVVFQAETKAARIVGNGAVSGVQLENGVALPAGLVLVGVGVEPATGWANGLMRAEDGGIEVDASMQAAPGIYAVGDIARFPFGGRRVRIEHWRLAQQHARVAARAIAGEPAGYRAAAYEGVPFFWTYHYGKRFEYLGHATAWDEVVVEGSLDEQDFAALLVKDGAVAGIVACQRERATSLLLHRMGGGLGAEEALGVIRGA